MPTGRFSPVTRAEKCGILYLLIGFARRWQSLAEKALGFFCPTQRGGMGFIMKVKLM